MLEIVSHSRNKGKCIRPSNESIHPTWCFRVLWMSWKRKVEERRWHENDTKGKERGNLIGKKQTKQKQNSSWIVKYLDNKHSDSWGFIMMAPQASAVKN